MTPAVRLLLGWYRKHGRTLPWRDTTRRDGTPDAYRIFVSELMLQQTQVARVIPKYDEWIKHFPSWKRLAEASTPDLLHAWAGLGYNRRALQMRESAREVVANGEPTDENGWRRLKGVGPYMAAALAEFANHKRALVIDTNVRRVAGRVFLGIPYPNPTTDTRLLRALDRNIPDTGRHWDIPQAFMDLGSSICTPRLPQCTVCPLRTVCKAAPLFLSGRAGVKPRAKNTETRHRNKKYPDRIYRGRILAHIRAHGSTKIERLGPFIDEAYDAKRDIEWVRRMVDRMIKDQFIVEGKKGIVSLPKN
ncbi:MAG: A/G-specific adenine glycosylase [Patescibacteria group bacterium]|jgi:A/G-specific adenine glycosylase